MNSNETNKTKDNLMQTIFNIIKAEIRNSISKMKTIKYISGITTSTEDENGYVKVRLVGDNKELSFINKTGEKILIGDTVFIEYYTTLTKGYIARRSGLYEQNIIVPVSTEEEAITDYISNKLYVVLIDEEE